MSTATQYQLLIKTLQQIQHNSFSVISIRDFIIRSHPDKTFDPASLRRWIYGRFKTFVKKGLLDEIAIPNSTKKRYALMPGFPEVTAMPPTKPSQAISIKKINNQLVTQAKAYQREIAIQLGEIAEYQKLSNDHPPLKPNLDKKSKQLTEKNYRLLGRLKAIEETLQHQD